MSLEHERIREELSAYLDGELGQAEARRVEEALKADSNLAAELDSLRAVREMVRRLPRCKAPAGMVERVIAGAGRATPVAGGRGTSWALRVGVAAAALIAVGIGAALLTLVGRPRGPESELVKALPRETAGRSRIMKGGPPAEPGKPATPDMDVYAAASIVTLNFFINTDNLAQAQRDVERVFRSNSLLLVAEDKALAQDGHLAKVRARSNFYLQTASTPTQIRYEMVIAEDQVRQIVHQLNAIRSRQKVAQIPMRDSRLGVGQTELAMVNGEDMKGDASGRRVLRGPRGRVSERAAGEPGKKAIDAPDSTSHSGQIALAYKTRPAAKPAPASRPAGAAVRGSFALAKEKPEPSSGEKSSTERFGAPHSKARRELGDTRGTRPTDVQASQPVTAKLGRRAPAATGPAAVRAGQRSEVLEDAGIKDGVGTLYAYMLRRRRGQATTFVGAKVRQLVVILNGVVSERSAGR